MNDTPPAAAASPSKNMKIVSWAVRIIAAAILGMAAMTKLTGDEVSAAIFETLGVGDTGMYVTGALEVITIVLLLIPKTAFFGGVLGVGLMGGAILSHITKLGIDMGTVASDHPALADADKLPGIEMFIMAVVVLLASATTVVLHKGGKKGGG